MAKQVLTNGYFLCNAVDLSNHAFSFDVEVSRDVVDVTSFGDTNKEYVLGIGDVAMTVGILMDYAVGSVDAVLFPLSQTNTPFVIELRPVNAARSTSNPAFVATVLLPVYAPLKGSVGDRVETDVSFVNASQTGLQRLTA